MALSPLFWNWGRGKLYRQESKSGKIFSAVPVKSWSEQEKQRTLNSTAMRKVKLCPNPTWGWNVNQGKWKQNRIVWLSESSWAGAKYLWLLVLQNLKKYFIWFFSLFWLKDSFPDKKKHCFSLRITWGFVAVEQWIDICLLKASVKVGQEEISPMICWLSMAIDFSVVAGEVYLAPPVQNWAVIWDRSQELEIKAVDATGAMAKKDFSKGAVWAPQNLFVPWTNCPSFSLPLHQKQPEQAEVMGLEWG